MGIFVVEGGHRLEGRIRPAGNKNAALPCIAAAVLASDPVTLKNVPRIRDVETFLEILVSLGAEVTWQGSSDVTVDARGVQRGAIDPKLAGRIRASVLLAGPLLFAPRDLPLLFCPLTLLFFPLTLLFGNFFLPFRLLPLDFLLRSRIAGDVALLDRFLLRGDGPRTLLIDKEQRHRDDRHHGGR